jgi:hypothetical protein
MLTFINEPLNKFKQTSLVFASLFILAFSISGQLFSLKASLQNKNQSQCASAFLVDDPGDDLDIEQIPSIHHTPYTPFPILGSSLQVQSFTFSEPQSSSQIRFYLEIQNLRI